MLMWQRHDPLGTLLTEPATTCSSNTAWPDHRAHAYPMQTFYLGMPVVGRVLVFLALVIFTEPVVTCFFEKKLDPVIPRAVPTLVTTFAGIGMARYISVRVCSLCTSG